MKIIDKIISNFINNKSLYIGEKVTISEHMIQSAMIAEKAKSSSNLICSCLLHDYWHFILEDPDKLVSQNLDGKHEDIGYEYLRKFFKKEVVEPIKYHVLAKRYLARERKYFNSLSDASKISLKLQGGVLNNKECNKFLIMELVEKYRSHSGSQEIYRHFSKITNCNMQFAIYSPDDSYDCPLLYFLSGITCTEQNFIQKSGFQKFASDYQIAVVVPDTSPRGEGIPDDQDYKLGCGAGFYLNATKEPWSKNYKMYDFSHVRFCHDEHNRGLRFSKRMSKLQSVFS